MKTKIIFAILILLKIVVGEDGCDYTKWTESDASVDKCKAALVGSGYCCYYNYPKRTSYKKGCVHLSKYQYDHISVMVKYGQTFGGDNDETEDKDASIDCKSFYLQFSLLILILLFLWI